MNNKINLCTTLSILPPKPAKDCILNTLVRGEMAVFTFYFNEYQDYLLGAGGVMLQDVTFLFKQNIMDQPVYCSWSEERSLAPEDSHFRLITSEKENGQVVYEKLICRLSGEETAKYFTACGPDDPLKFEVRVDLYPGAEAVIQADIPLTRIWPQYPIKVLDSITSDLYDRVDPE